MADRVAKRAGPVWVWALGFIVLLVLVWLVVRLLDEDGQVAVDEDTPLAAEMLQDDAAVAEEEIREVERVAMPVPLSAVVPLQAADTGVRVEFEGNRIGDAIDAGLWVRTREGELVFVRLVDGAASGEPADGAVAGTGIVRFDAEGRLDGWLREAEVDPAERAGLIREYYVETTTDRLERR